MTCVPMYILAYVCHNAHIFQEERSRSYERKTYRNFHRDVCKVELHVARQIQKCLYVRDNLKFAQHTP